MVARFFIDENDLRLGRELACIHEGVVYPGHPNLPQVPRGALDDEWLQVIGSMRLCVITRDARIRYRPAEKKQWVDHKVRGFVLTGRKSQSTKTSLTILAKHWSEINRHVDGWREGPWMFAVTNDGLREIEL